MKICLGKELVEDVKKKSENEKNLLKNRNSEDINELDADDVYFHSNAVKNIKLGTQLVNRIYLNHSIVYELEDTINLNLFHSLVPAATATSILFDKIENQNISNYNFIGYCDANNHIAVCQNNTEYLVLNIRNAVIYAPNSCYQFLYNYKALTICNIENFNTANVTNMHTMFCNCSSLKNLDLSNFNTQNVRTMDKMFYNCQKLVNLDLSNFNTQNVTSMGYMFAYCSNLTNVNLSSFNTQNITNMTEMFCSCANLTGVDLSSFNMQNVISTYSMFYNCLKLAYIISKTFNIAAITSSNLMFFNCIRLVGGNGTTYSSSHVTAEYARVDGENGLPGYFTAPSANNK